MPIVTTSSLRALAFAASATLAATLATTPVSAALNAFLKIGGAPAPASAADARGGHKEWIEVTSWSWGASNGHKGWDGTIKGRRDAVAPAAASPATTTAPGPGPGTLRVKVRFPWTDCRVGADFPDATLDDAVGRNSFSDVTVTRCDADAVTFGYSRVTVRGWDPAKKEE